MKERVVKKSIYAIDTTGPFCTVALLLMDEEQNIIKITSETSDKKISHVSEILVLTEKLFYRENIEIKEVDAIGVSVGPGSYTGIRVGLSTARALGQIFNTPILPISSLEPFAFYSDSKTVICAIFNARRKQVYGGAYVGKSIDDSSEELLHFDKEWNQEETIIKDGPYLIDEFLNELKNKIGEKCVKEKIAGHIKKIIFLGDGVDAYQGELEAFSEDMKSLGINVNCPEEVRYQNSEFVAMRSYQKFINGEDISFREAKPEYMRKVEAEQKLDEKRKKVRENISFRRALKSDVDEMIVIENKCFQDPWSKVTMEYEVENGIYIVGEYEGKIISYGGIFMAGGDGTIHDFAVDPSFTNGKVGYIMGKALIEEAYRNNEKPIDITLEVRESNNSAIKLYENLDFENVGIRPKYYHDGENAVIMWRYSSKEGK